MSAWGLVFGLIITVMIYALGHISGAHFNPAVTLGFVLARHFPVKRLLGYWLAQCSGAILAAGCLRLLLGNVANLGTTLPMGSGGAWQSFGLEALLTFFLMFVIMAMATDTRAVGQAATLAIGSTVALEALFAGPISRAVDEPCAFPGSSTGEFHLDRAVGLSSGSTTRSYHRGTRLSLAASGWTARRAKKVRGASIMMQRTHPEAVPMQVLFLCTHNSSRSQMAEGLLQARGGATYAVFSAGTQPRTVHPLAIKTMRELGIDISDHYAKGIEAFRTQPPMDLVVTVCDDATESCPFFPHARRQEHWGFPDPSRVEGNEEERLAAFRHVRDLIATRITQFLARSSATSCG